MVVLAITGPMPSHGRTQKRTLHSQAALLKASMQAGGDDVNPRLYRHLAAVSSIVTLPRRPAGTNEIANRIYGGMAPAQNTLSAFPAFNDRVIQDVATAFDDRAREQLWRNAAA